MRELRPIGDPRSCGNCNSTVESRPPRRTPGLEFSRKVGGRPGKRAIALTCAQRLATYIVISMPKRISIAAGVSHFMQISFFEVRQHSYPLIETPNQPRNEKGLMIFMRRA